MSAEVGIENNQGVRNPKVGTRLPESVSEMIDTNRFVRPGWAKAMN